MIRLCNGTNFYASGCSNYSDFKGYGLFSMFALVNVALFSDRSLRGPAILLVEAELVNEKYLLRYSNKS